jgi:hypothetical protein
MGAVYRARDTKLGREVALKVLPDSFASDPDRLMRFEREAKTLAALNHPHIAQIHHLEQHASTGSGQAGVSALVMELVEGEDLSERIARGLGQSPSSQRALERIDLQGETVVMLARVGLPCGGTWHQEGGILYTSSCIRDIRRLHAGDPVRRLAGRPALSHQHRGR